MKSDKLVRVTLGLSFFFNLGAAYLLIFAASPLAQFAGFTASTSPMHTSLSALMVGSLGIAYGWLSRQEVIDRPMLALGALIKGAAFLMFVVQWLFDAVTGRFVLFAVVDIVLAFIWLNWLMQTRRA